ncbi:MAG: cellulase family glycosylhydrolase [Bryobacterales bacterium]|nr:cellulase family glycosylhydrolase [Bryobacterales bacterium]
MSPNEFVRRQGPLLTLNEKPFRFLGNNVYFNQADIAYGLAANVEETFDHMAALGLTVARCNAHNDNDPALDPAAIQTRPGQYDEANLVALDQSIALAKARDLRLILRFTNYWEAYGGVRRYVSWFLGRPASPREAALFFTEPQIRFWFQDYVRSLIDRVNTVTGVTYRNEPAILAWELGNEFRNPGDPDALLRWTAEMAGFIRQLDANHLIADGGEGFDDAPQLYTGLSNRHAVNGADGGSFHRLVQIPEIDMASYHLYPTNWRMNDSTDAALYIQRHEQIARDAGKVAYMGEFGKPLPDPQRARLFAHWLSAARDSAGALLWQLLPDSKLDAEGYQVYSRDTETCAVLRAR